MVALSELSDAQRDQALGRYAVLRPHLEDGVSLARAARAAGVPERTARRWLARLHTGGLAGLARAGRADRGTRRTRAELVALTEGLALRRPPPSIAHVYRQVSGLAVERGWSAPSYATTRAIIAALDRGLLALARHGPAAYRDGFELALRREASAPNAIWQADHTQLDLLLDPEGRPARPWLTVILDDFSRAVAGYAVYLDAPSALQTALALRHAIWRKDDPAWPVCGIPELLYTDHGSDFTSRHLEQVAADLHLRLIFSTPGVPQGRGKIERFFGSVTTELLPTLPGYLAPDRAGGPVEPLRRRLASRGVITHAWRSSPAPGVVGRITSRAVLVGNVSLAASRSASLAARGARAGGGRTQTIEGAAGTRAGSPRLAAPRWPASGSRAPSRVGVALPRAA